MKNLMKMLIFLSKRKRKKLIFIFERDFVNQEDDVTEIHDIDLEIIEETDTFIKANIKLSASFDDDEFGFIEIDENVYKKKHLKVISEMEKYQKELNKGLYILGQVVEFIGKLKIKIMKNLKITLQTPLTLVDILLSLVFNYISRLNVKYKEQSARLDFGMSLGSFHKLTDKVDNFGNPLIKEIGIKDITNRKFRRSLRFSSLFKKWHIYQLDTNDVQSSNVSDGQRQRVYISKDKLDENSLVTGTRISDYQLSKNYSSKRERLYLKSRGITRREFYKLEPQVYIICAEKSDRHEKQSEIRKIRYAKNKANKLTKQIKKAIKNDDLYSRVSSWDDQTPLNLAIKNNRYDLIEMVLKYANEIDEVDKVLNYVHKDWSDYPKEHKPLDMVNDEKMKAYLTEKGAK